MTTRPAPGSFLARRAAVHATEQHQAANDLLELLMTNDATRSRFLTVMQDLAGTEGITLAGRWLDARDLTNRATAQARIVTRS